MFLVLVRSRSYRTELLLKETFSWYYSPDSCQHILQETHVMHGVVRHALLLKLSLFFVLLIENVQLCALCLLAQNSS